MAEQFCSDLLDIAVIINNPPATPGAVPRDPDDDKIVACAIAAGAEYLVSRDHDLLSIGGYAGVAIIAPEDFLHVVRAQTPGP
jgi:predicted nucleic acid-binding protein